LAENAAVIILSNLGQEEDIKKGLDLGVSGYIVKALATPAEVVNKAVDISDHKKSN
jgi:DNA-binding NarL/FixJ family response regulator